MDTDIPELKRIIDDLNQENESLIKQLCKIQIDYENLYRKREKHNILFNEFMNSYLLDKTLYGYELNFHPLIACFRFVHELQSKLYNKNIADRYYNLKNNKSENFADENIVRATKFEKIKEVAKLIKKIENNKFNDIEKFIKDFKFEKKVISFFYDLLAQNKNLDKEISSIFALKAWEFQPKSFRLKKYSFILYEENVNNALLSFIILAILDKKVILNKEEKIKSKEIEQKAREMLTSDKYIESNQKLKRENLKLKNDNQKLKEDLNKEKMKFVNVNSNLAEKFGDLLNEFCSVKKNQDLLVKKIINVRN